MVLLPLKHVARNRAFLSLLVTFNGNTSSFLFSTLASASASPSTQNPLFFDIRNNNNTSSSNLSSKDVVLSFKEWFKSRNRNPLLEQIFEILSSTHQDDKDDLGLSLALSQLGLLLSEKFVLEVLNYGKRDVLSCLKFFDWAGSQGGFHHTRATCNAIFKILSKSKLMSLMLDFLDNYFHRRYIHRVRFYDTLVMGYAISGKPHIALQVFGKMRFMGLDLDGFAYHVFFNALVEQKCFDVAQVVAKQISMRGFESEVTDSIMIKSFCKQNRFDEAEELLRSRERVLNGHGLSSLVDALCKSNQFERAGKLVEELRESGVGMDCMEHAYTVYIRDLLQAGKADGALEFLQSKNMSSLDNNSKGSYIPNVFCYNTLICRLLRENRLEEVCDLLMEMHEGKISPDKVTMNAALCFFCKAGMVDVALELYNSRSEFGLSPNSLAYNYLINTLCGDWSIDEAYLVLKNSIDQGYFPGRKTFSILADALCREGKIDKMKEMISFALQRNFMPSESIYDKFISALCKARRVEDGYLIHEELNRINKVNTTKNTYVNLIRGFCNSNRGDIAARLLLEMQEKGYIPTRSLFRSVICRLCDMENPEKQFLRFMEMQLSRHEPNYFIYNLLIDGAGHARKPELARAVFVLMQRSGIEPNLVSDIFMLQSYLKNDRISDALNFFSDLRQRRTIRRKLYNTMVVGLCKANREAIAMEFLQEMRDNGVVPSNECYEVLVQLFCLNKRYDIVVSLINDLEKIGRHVTSFIGNTLVFYSLKNPELYDAWIHLREVHNKTASDSLMLDQLIGVFCGRIRVSQDIENLEEMIKQCFPPNIFTYNILLKRLCTGEVDHACEFFSRIRQKGYEPNRWTYEILVRALFKNGRTAEARRLLEEMFQKGLDPTKPTKQII